MEESNVILFAMLYIYIYIERERETERDRERQRQRQKFYLNKLIKAEAGNFLDIYLYIVTAMRC